MAHSSTPVFVRWRGNFYLVRYHVIDNPVTVEADPPNQELQEAVRISVEQDPFKQLAVYKGFGYDYLLNDPKRGE